MGTVGRNAPEQKHGPCTLAAFVRFAPLIGAERSSPPPEPVSIDRFALKSTRTGVDEHSSVTGVEGVTGNARFASCRRNGATSTIDRVPSPELAGPGWRSKVRSSSA